MKPLTEFYEGLHSTHKDYSAGTYNFKPLFASRALRQWAQSKAGAAIRFLDVGCGKGLFLREIVVGLQQRWDIGAAPVPRPGFVVRRGGQLGRALGLCELWH